MGTPCPDLGPVSGVLPRKDMGSVEVLWDGDGVPRGKDMGPVEVLWDGDGDGVPAPPPPRCEQAENKTSRLVLSMRSVKNRNFFDDW